MIADKALKVFKSKYFVIPIAVLSLVIVCIILYFASIKDEVILPASDHYLIDGYTDDINGGKTQILEQHTTDSAFVFRFQLKDGFYSPYAGFSIMPKNSHYIDAGKYNQISLCLNGENIDRLGIALYTPIPEEYHLKTEEEDLHHSYLNISQEKACYQIPFDQLKHPEWWEDLHQISEQEKVEPDFSRIIHVNVGSAYAPEIESEKSIVVYSIAFTRNNTSIYMALGILFIAVPVLLFLFIYWRLFRTSAKEEITISYKPVEVENTNTFNDEQCIDYINKSFHNNELSLDLVANETGIPQRKITQIINERYDCNFKTYINRIRIKEAQRLLVKTELNIGEIAFKVGFNNQSHFNRVFKVDCQMSPSEYRDNQS